MEENYTQEYIEEAKIAIGITAGNYAAYLAENPEATWEEFEEDCQDSHQTKMEDHKMKCGGY